MICPKCEKQVTNDFMFCPECGTFIDQQNQPDTDDRMENADKDASEKNTMDVKEEIQVPDKNENKLTLHDSEDTGRILNETVITINSEVDMTPDDKEVVQADEIIEQPVIHEKNDLSKPDVPEFTGEQRTVIEQPVIVQGIPVENESSQRLQESAVNQHTDKPISTAGVFISFIFYAIPVVGLICLIISAFSGQKKSRKSLARAILIYRCIFLSVLSIWVIWAYIFNRDLLFSWFDRETWVRVFDSIRNNLF